MEGIKKADLRELKSFANPPQLVIDVMGITCMIVAGDNKFKTWKEVRVMFGNSTGFLRKAKEIDKLSPETISKVKRALEIFESLDNAKDEIRRVSAASASCLGWVLSLI